MLASASKDGSIKLWRFDAAKNLWTPDGTLLGHNGSVNSVAFHPKQNDLLLSAGNDGSVRLWRPITGAWTSTTLQNVGGESGPVHQAIFSPLDKNGDCDIFAAAGDKVNVWNSDGKPLRSLSVKQPVQCLAVSPKREWLVAGVGNAAWVYKQDAVDGEPVQKVPGHTAELTALAFSDDGERLFTAGRNRQVKVWDAIAWATADPKQPVAHELLTLEQHKDSVVSLCLFPSAKFPALLSAGADGQAILWRYVPWNNQ
jgi:WD40 repeat protein